VSDGSTAVVLSYGNAGTVDQWGVDVGAAVTVSETLALTSTGSLFTSAVRENVAGNVLSANTPRNKGTVALSYAGRRGLTIDVDARFVERYHWISGIYDGEVPAAQTVNLSAGYRVNPNVRMTLAATNVLDQQRFQIYGGAVVGRRIVVGATSTF
jgi:outer membrane receptor protein involved in Fe transport